MFAATNSCGDKSFAYSCKIATRWCQQCKQQAMRGQRSLAVCLSACQHTLFSLHACLSHVSCGLSKHVSRYTSAREHMCTRFCCVKWATHASGYGSFGFKTSCKPPSDHPPGHTWDAEVASQTLFKPQTWGPLRLTLPTF